MDADRLDSLMGIALDEASEAMSSGEIPVGAVIVNQAGEVLAKGRNRREELGDPTAHAELLAISAAARSVEGWRLDGHILVVTLEPCPMCAGAAVAGRLDAIVYGAADPKGGAAWSLYNIPQDKRLNHRCEVVAGIREEECGDLLRRFFALRRFA
jgi:tRNA(adenine34) deaminase